MPGRKAPPLDVGPCIITCGGWRSEAYGWLGWHSSCERCGRTTEELESLYRFCELLAWLLPLLLIAAKPAPPTIVVVPLVAAQAVA